MTLGFDTSAKHRIKTTWRAPQGPACSLLQQSSKQRESQESNDGTQNPFTPQELLQVIHYKLLLLPPRPGPSRTLPLGAPANPARVSFAPRTAPAAATAASLNLPSLQPDPLFLQSRLAAPPVARALSTRPPPTCPRRSGPSARRPAKSMHTPSFLLPNSLFEIISFL